MEKIAEKDKKEYLRKEKEQKDFKNEKYFRKRQKSGPQKWKMLLKRIESLP